MKFRRIHVYEYTERMFVYMSTQNGCFICGRCYPVRVEWVPAYFDSQRAREVACNFDSLGPMSKIPLRIGGPPCPDIRVLPVRASWYVISASCLVPSSKWQRLVRWPQTAGYKMCNLIWRPPVSRGKIKSAVDVFSDMCHACLLHLTKAAVSCLNSFSGHMITGPEKARKGAKVHSTNLRLFLIERSIFFRRKHAISMIPSMTYFRWARCQATCYTVCPGA